MERRFKEVQKEKEVPLKERWRGFRRYITSAFIELRTAFRCLFVIKKTLYFDYEEILPGSPEYEKAPYVEVQLGGVRIGVESR